MFLTAHVTVCLCHAQLKGYLLTYLPWRETWHTTSSKLCPWCEVIWSLPIWATQKPLFIWPPLFHICITLPVESAPFFIPSTSFCSLSSWLTSSWTHHLITVITFALTIFHSLGLSLQTKTSSLSQILSSIHSLSGSFRTDFTDLEPVLN